MCFHGCRFRLTNRVSLAFFRLRLPVVAWVVDASERTALPWPDRGLHTPGARSETSLPYHPGIPCGQLGSSKRACHPQARSSPPVCPNNVARRTVPTCREQMKDLMLQPGAVLLFSSC